MIPLAIALKAATADIIHSYSFGESSNYIARDDYNALFFQAIDPLLSFAHLFTHIAWLCPLMEKLPRKIAAGINPGLASLYDMEDVSSFSPVRMRLSTDQASVMGKPDQ